MKLYYKHGEGKHFDITVYPDMQRTITLDLNYFNDPKEPIEIICNIRKFGELEILFCLIAAFRKADFYVDKITFNYLFGMRSDRVFSPGQANYFRDVVAPLLNYIDIPIEIFFPHSQLSMNALTCATPIYAHIPGQQSTIAIGADKSATLNDWGYNDYSFHKIRDESGIVVTLDKDTHDYINEQPDYYPIFIYDDLCDGGATFIAIADYLRHHFPNRKRFLFIAHGLFTKGIEHVMQHYDKLIVTNSWKDFPVLDKLQVIDVWGDE